MFWRDNNDTNQSVFYHSLLEPGAPDTKQIALHHPDDRAQWIPPIAVQPRPCGLGEKVEFLNFFYQHQFTIESYDMLQYVAHQTLSLLP